MKKIVLEILRSSDTPHFWAHVCFYDTSLQNNFIVNRTIVKLIVSANVLGNHRVSTADKLRPFAKIVQTCGCQV
ncbi:hypothetical protein MT325_m175R [Paramecium bursaria chlorella virus MT325]|uniref:Uncharacterized protein m175R n=2 Tax=Paramecium bursaria Chlorella virus A1 TaxID=381899 RepID=A7ITQ5_PBCVM|nr:hypothetical protein FR483_n178R [Paramecium bursaria Chlorella virus FR483]ABT13729.1 hypothetical protein MT325_m175R [Paramecium bursaria chlorella virus MT325]ABT15463.1 hypothetical protein FR483_n178R [Paramecium bursaria Chlorella virus FR483]